MRAGLRSAAAGFWGLFRLPLRNRGLERQTASRAAVRRQCGCRKPYTRHGPAAEAFRGVVDGSDRCSQHFDHRHVQLGILDFVEQLGRCIRRSLGAQAPHSAVELPRWACGPENTPALRRATDSVTKRRMRVNGALCRIGAPIRSGSCIGSVAHAAERCGRSPRTHTRLDGRPHKTFASVSGQRPRAVIRRSANCQFA